MALSQEDIKKLMAGLPTAGQAAPAPNFVPQTPQAGVGPTLANEAQATPPPIDPNGITFPTLGGSGMIANTPAASATPQLAPQGGLQQSDLPQEFIDSIVPNTSPPPLNPLGAEFPTLNQPTPGSITKGGETFTTQGFGEQTSSLTGLAPIGQSNPIDVAARQGFETQNADRIAGLTPDELARETAMNDAAVNRRQIQTEEAQGLFRPSEGQIGQAQTESVARQADYEQRQVNNRIDSDMRQFKRDNMNATPEETAMHRQQLMQQESLVESPTPEGGRTFEQGIAERKQTLAEQKQRSLAAKEAAGVQLTPSEQLAREKWEAEKAAGPAKTSTERNIEILMNANPDLSYSEAVNIEQGVVSKTVNPLTGATETTNIASGESTPVTSTVPLPDASLNLEPAEPGTSLFERGQEFTGAIEAGLRAGQKVAGQFGGKIVSDESTQTKKELDAFQGNLVRAFQEGDRFSTGQDKVLREELDATLGAMKDPETFKNNAIALDKVMRQRHADLIENYNDTTMDSDFRADSRSKSRVLESAIRDLGVTQEAEGDGAERVPMPEGINKAVTQDLWDEMTPEEQSVFNG